MCGRLLQPRPSALAATLLYQQMGDVSRCSYVYSVPVVSTWREIHSPHRSQVISMAASVQRHGGYDGPVVACSTTVSIFHRSPAGQGPW